MRAAYIGSKIKYADLAQLVEHILGKDEVTSSNLVISSNRNAVRLCGLHTSVLKSNMLI